jgi:hypothetical protein
MAYGLDAAENALCLPGDRMTRIQRCALKAVLRSWPEFRASYYLGNGRNSLERPLTEMARGCLRDEVREEYGSAVALFILFTVAGAALSWLIERLLDRLFPPKSGFGLDTSFAAQLSEWSKNL